MHLDWGRFDKNRPWKDAGFRNFVEACARIAEGEPRTRLAGILWRNVFKDAPTDLRNNVKGVDD
jgi:hypothetical protein